MSRRSIEPKRLFRPLLRQPAALLATALLLGVVGVAATAALRAPDQGASSESAPVPGALGLERADPPRVRVEQVVVDDGYTRARSLAGRVEARRETRVGFEQGGMVDAVRVEEGDRVTSGAVLARLDTDLLEATRRELEAAVAGAEADRRLAEATLDRHRRAIERRAVSPQALSEAERAHEAATAGLERARAALESHRVRIDKSTLRAPYDAWVVARLVDEGQVIGVGTPVFELLEDAPVDVRVGVPADLAAALVPGDRHRVSVGGRSYDATVRSIAPRLAEVTRVVDVVLSLEERLAGPLGRGSLRQGDLARLELEDRVAVPGVRLPLSALTEGVRGLWAVYIVPGDAAVAPVERRPVEMLQPGATTVFVRGPLAAGERVVVEGVDRLVPGLDVRAVATSDAGANR